MSQKTFLTGASSGIGRALALELASRGHDLVLAARRVDALSQLQAELVAQYPQRQVTVVALDVTVDADVAAAVEKAGQTMGGLDLVIANAGIGSNGMAGKGKFAQDRAVIETNVIGAMATVDAAVALFRRSGKGHIVVVSSVAAFRGLPGSGAYSASKAAIAVYADAVRTELHGSGIQMTTLFPGYIDTPINQNLKSRPFLIPVDQGARIIADLIQRQVGTATVPVWPWNVVGRLLRWVPTALLARSVKSARG